MVDIETEIKALEAQVVKLREEKAALGEKIVAKDKLIQDFFSAWARHDRKPD